MKWFTIANFVGNPGPPCGTTRHPGYAISQRKRKRIKEPAGPVDDDATPAKCRHHGEEVANRQMPSDTAAHRRKVARAPTGHISRIRVSERIVSRVSTASTSHGRPRTSTN